MKTFAMKQRMAPRARGFVLLDALVSILIFSIGILGLLAVQANAARLASDAKYRTDAALQADRLIAQMWMADPSTLATSFAGTGASSSSGSDGGSGAAAAPTNPGYNAWLKDVDCSTAVNLTNCLPGVTANPPTVTVSATGLVTITIRWLGPSQAADSPHQYVSVTQIDRT